VSAGGPILVSAISQPLHALALPSRKASASIPDRFPIRYGRRQPDQGEGICYPPTPQTV